MMKLKYLFFSLLSIISLTFSSNTQKQSDKVEKAIFSEIESYIKQDTLLHSDNTNLCLSSEIIAPLYSMLDYEILKKKYRLSDSEITDGKFATLINKVQDSIINLEEITKEEFVYTNQKKRTRFIKSRNPSHCLYCSNYTSNSIYCDLIKVENIDNACLPYKSITQTYVIGYLFEFDKKSKIKTVYESVYHVD